MSNKLNLLVNFIGVDKMSGALRNIVGLGRDGSKSIRALSGEAKKLEREMTKVQRSISRGSGNMTDLINRERELEGQLRQTNEQLKRQQRLAAINADARAMQRRGDELKARGQENIVGGASMAAPLIAATAAAAQFSSGMVDIQQKAELSDQATDRLGNRIVQLAQIARQMPEDMRSGLDALLAKGMNLDAATAAIGPAGRLATAYKVELPDAANAAFASISNLKVASAETGKIFDAMAAAGNAGGFEVRDMARYFPSLTAQMQALGEKGVPAVADLSAALQVAMHTAGNADEAGNNIQNLLGKINAPGTIAAFKKNFGIDLPAAMKKLQDQGMSSMEAIATLTKTATKGDMKKLGFAFEDQQARMGILALIQNMEEYKRIRAQAMQSGGTVDRQFNQRVARDATVEWRAFLASASSVAIMFGATLLPVMTEVFGYVGALGYRMAEWAQRNPELAGTLTQLAAGFVAARIGLGVLQFAFGSIIGPLGSAIRFARMAGPVFTTLRTAALFLGQGVMRAGMMMLANPMVLAIVAIGAAIGLLAYLVYANWAKIKGAFVAGWNWVKATLAAAPQWLSNLGRMMMQGLLLAINPMALALKLIDVAKNGITAFKNYFGIKSPSRLMMQMGGHVATGLAQGIDGGSGKPQRAMSQMAAGVARAGAVSLTPMAAGGAGVAKGGPMGGGGSVTIQVYGAPGQSVEQLAEIVMRKLEAAKGVKARSSYEGDR
ncbi:MAG: phage tail tape measure protein [Novosphingobium sp.]